MKGTHNRPCFWQDLAFIGRIQISKHGVGDATGDAVEVLRFDRLWIIVKHRNTFGCPLHPLGFQVAVYVMEGELDAVIRAFMFAVDDWIRADLGNFQRQLVEHACVK